MKEHNVIDEKDPMGLGPMIKSIRDRHNLTLENAAEETGVSLSSLSRLEHGLGCHVSTYFKLIPFLEKYSKKP